MSAHEKSPVVDEEDDGLPSWEEVEARFAASRNQPPPPWLTPEGLAAMKAAIDSGIPEISGPLDGTIPPQDD
jgi:hypothetical protein